MIKDNRLTGLRLAAAAGILAVFAAWHLGAAAAVFRTEDAVHIDPDGIENATLAIGTHLIYLHALNEEIYGIALDSASASGQDRWYYKSELAGGMWVDISDAGALEDITAAGRIVDVSEIQALYFTHHTKPDGVTYSLTTDAPVCIFDIVDVYDLEYLPELEALKLQYDMMQESSSAKAVRSRNLVRDFFVSKVRSDRTDRCDAQIRALQKYYNELAANGADSRDTQMVLRVMEKLDYTRRAAVFTAVDSRLVSLQERIAGVVDEDGSGDFLTAIGESQYAVGESLTEAEGNMLAEGTTVLSEKEYELSNSMIRNAEAADYRGCDDQNQKLQYLDNISGGRIVSRQGELELLEELIGAADARYGEGLSGGVTPQYTTLVSQRVSHAALQGRMREDMTGVNAARSELEFLIQGKADRCGDEEAQKYILSRIQDAAWFRAQIKADDYQQGYQDSVAAYVDWLNSLLRSIREDSGSQGGEETLYGQKEALQEQKLRALDNLDLDTAKRTDALIADLDERIDAAEGASAAQLRELEQKKAGVERQLAGDPSNAALQAELGRLEAEIADCETGMEADSQAASIMAGKREILSLLASGDTSDAAAALLEGDVGLLASMVEEGSALALEASKEVYQKLLAKSELEGVKTYQGLQDQIETAIAGSAAGAVENTGLSQGTGSGMGGTVEQGSGDGISGTGQGSGTAGYGTGSSGAAAEAGSGSLGKDPAQAVKDLIDSLQGTNGVYDKNGNISSFEALADAVSQAGDMAACPARKQEGEVYVSVESLASYLGYRYVWNDTKRSAVLSRGRYFFRFTAFTDIVETGAGGTVSMKHPVKFFDILYIPGSFVEEQFDCYVHDISGTDYAVLVKE